MNIIAKNDDGFIVTITNAEFTTLVTEANPTADVQISTKNYIGVQISFTPLISRLKALRSLEEKFNGYDHITRPLEEFLDCMSCLKTDTMLVIKESKAISP